MGVKQWSVNQCVTEFIRLCYQAFTPREFNKLVALNQATTIVHGSKYKTTPLREAMRSAFGNEQLYGGRRKAHCIYNIQVAVTAASGTGEQGLLLANYSRPEENEPDYKFEFPHHLEVWEAACATSAAPSFFKPFQSASTSRTYLDGAIYYNNPVRIANHERKFLWPDVADSPPDILLSIGTGKNGQQIHEELEDELYGRPNIRRAKLKSFRKTWKWRSIAKLNAKRKLKKDKPSTLVSKFFSVLVCHASPSMI